MNTVKIQLAKKDGFHDAVNHIDAGVAEAWVESGVCRIVADKTNQPETASVPSQSPPKSPKKSAVKD